MLENSCLRSTISVLFIISTISDYRVYSDEVKYSRNITFKTPVKQPGPSYPEFTRTNHNEPATSTPESQNLNTSKSLATDQEASTEHVTGYDKKESEVQKTTTNNPPAGSHLEHDEGPKILDTYVSSLLNKTGVKTTVESPQDFPEAKSTEGQSEEFVTRNRKQAGEMDQEEVKDDEKLEQKTSFKTGTTDSEDIVPQRDQPKQSSTIYSISSFDQQTSSRNPPTTEDIMYIDLQDSDDVFNQDSRRTRYSFEKTDFFHWSTTTSQLEAQTLLDDGFIVPSRVRDVHSLSTISFEMTRQVQEDSKEDFSNNYLSSSIYWSPQITQNPQAIKTESLQVISTSLVEKENVSVSEVTATNYNLIDSALESPYNSRQVQEDSKEDVSNNYLSSSVDWSVKLQSPQITQNPQAIKTESFQVISTSLVEKANVSVSNNLIDFSMESPYNSNTFDSSSTVLPLSENAPSMTTSWILSTPSSTVLPLSENAPSITTSWILSTPSSTVLPLSENALSITSSWILSAPSSAVELQEYSLQNYSNHGIISTASASWERGLTSLISPTTTTKNWNASDAFPVSEATISVAIIKSSSYPTTLSTTTPSPCSMIKVSRTSPTGERVTESNQDEEEKPEDMTLPIYVCMSLAQNWTEFCSKRRKLKIRFSHVFDRSEKEFVGPDRFVFARERFCNNQSKRFDPKSRGISVYVYTLDKRGNYSENLTKKLGNHLNKSKLHSNKEDEEVDKEICDVKIYESRVQTKTVVHKFARSISSNGMIAAITISAIAGIALMLMFTMLLILKQRQEKGHDSTSSSDSYSMNSFSGQRGSNRRKKPSRLSIRSFLNQAFDEPEVPSHPLNFSHLSTALQNHSALEEEFKNIATDPPKLDALPPGAETKNRYANVVPVPETMVPLHPDSEHPGYINANFIRGYGGKAKAYIATQAPLPDTMEDFWRMVWEQQSRVVVMLTPMEENGSPRCAPYFPVNTVDCHQLFGDFQVSLIEKDSREKFTKSTFRLHDLEKNLFRDIYHLWYTAWPAQGLPSDNGAFMNWVLEIRALVPKNSGPLIVHCSSGTGKTGTFIVIDSCMHEFQETRCVDIMRCVARLRQDRQGCVQTADQYRFIHEVLHEYAMKLGNQSHRPSLMSLVSLKLSHQER